MQQIIIKSYETKRNVIPHIVFLAIGLILFLNPGGIVEFISYIIGGVFLALGISKYVIDARRQDRTTGDMFYSFIMIALGLIFIFFSSTVEFILRLLIGIWIIINGINTIVIGISTLKEEKKNIVSMVVGLILVIIGLYTIFVSNLILSALGLVICIYSVLEVIDYIYAYITSKK